MMGASQVLPIYMFVKILYSAFLFLHGWSQFLNFLQRGDYSIVRFLQDLFRLNLMTVLLCLCMNRPYQFYDFVSEGLSKKNSYYKKHHNVILTCLDCLDSFDFILDTSYLYRAKHST
jgi:hypothetical protein